MPRFSLVAVRDDAVGVVVDHLVPGPVVLGGEERLGDREADAVGKALPERAGRQLDAGGDADLGVPRRDAAHLPELLQILDADVIAVQVQQRVEQRRTVPGREHEAVPVEPGRILRVEAEVVVPDDVGHRGRAERESGVTVLRRLDRVDGEHPDGVDRQRLGRGLYGSGQGPVLSHLRHGSTSGRHRRSRSRGEPPNRDPARVSRVRRGARWAGMTWSERSGIIRRSCALPVHGPCQCLEAANHPQL